ncbi:MAG: response regulator transcription factor [Cellvibrio sp.]|uniref:LuxR family transcriptional regulator n=1 Tax=Cellvibrio sp. TaxID=1965322 RepID=UPI0031A29CAC
MISHLFFSPVDITSPRWLQAFPTARVDAAVAAVDETHFVWLLLRDELSFLQIQSLSATGAKVIAMTAIENPQEARRALEAGASGYVHYLAAAEVLAQVAQVVATGGMWLGAELMRQLVLATARILPATPTPKADLSLLTSRERAVAELVAAGKTNKEVARDLDITERTVKAHLGATFEKLQVRDRLQLVLVFSQQ